ncbi:TPA: transposase [Citrobacter braakii]|nr:transposase [Citrobacter sp. RHB35-C21]HAT7507020.1 transposase [Citrobacter braakii]HCU0797016.1 transposase [Citrobacter braakii]
MWAYVSGETTGDGVVCFDCQPGRAARYPEAWLASWSGILVTDGYATTVCETATGCAVGLADGAAERRGAVWLAEIGAETSAFITGRATARTITLREKSPE